MARDIVTDGARRAFEEALHDLGDDPTGRVLRSLVGIRGMLDAILNIRSDVQRLVNAGSPSVDAADVTAVTALHAKMVQACKDWAVAL